MDLRKKTALITGGAKGIGRAIGLALGSQGWSVALCYRTSHAEAVETGQEIVSRGGAALVEQCDVSLEPSCAALVKKVGLELGPIDALINCVGPYHRVGLLEETPEGWLDMFAQNLHPLFYLSRLVAPQMIERKWGRIISFSMANADRMLAQPQLAAHYIAKVGVLTLTRALAKQLAPHQITANTISPGFIASGSAPDDELLKMVKHIPAGYVGELADATSAALYLLSDEARYVNGTNLLLSGGWGL